MTKETIFGIEFKKFKKEFSLRIALLCLPFVLLFVAHLALGGNIFQKIGFAEMRNQPVGLDDLLLITLLVPIFILPLSFLHYKSRKTVYRAWLIFSGLGLFLFIWSLVIYMTMSQYDERRTIALTLLALSYVVGSILIWGYGFLTKNTTGIGIRGFKKKLSLLCVILSIPALSLWAPYLFFESHWSRNLPFWDWLGNRDDLFATALFIPLIVLALSLLHYKSRETVYKAWLAYSGLGSILFVCCVVIYNPRDFFSELPQILLGLAYAVGSILIWGYGVITEKKTNNDVFGVGLKKFKKWFLVSNSLLLIAGGSLYLKLFVPYWLGLIDDRTLHFSLKAFGLHGDIFEIIVVIPPAVLTFLSLLHYKSRETVYKAWLAYSLLGLIYFTLLLKVSSNYLDTSERLHFWYFGGVYVGGSIIIWLLGVMTSSWGKDGLSQNTVIITNDDTSDKEIRI